MSIAHGFGMKIIAYDVYPPKENVKEKYDAEMV
jgi:phosphoglycerate dehydrogenase-like enzyme